MGCSRLIFLNSDFLACHWLLLNFASATRRGTGSIEALRHINLHVDPGEFIGVVGASGSGKSTLLRLIAGLEMPTSGKLYLNRREIVQPGADRGMVFQGYTLYPWMTLQKNVEFGLKLQGMPPKERREVHPIILKLWG